MLKAKPKYDLSSGLKFVVKMRALGFSVSDRETSCCELSFWVRGLIFGTGWQEYMLITLIYSNLTQLNCDLTVGVSDNKGTWRFVGGAQHRISLKIST